MCRIYRFMGLFLLAAACAAPLVNTGCAARVRYYDDYHHDYHRWNNHEDVEYRIYLNGRHEDYREFRTLDRDRQNDYWKWRHDHPDHH
jgi:hypothetical protein